MAATPRALVLVPTAAGPTVHVPPTESVTDAALADVVAQPPLTNATRRLLAGGENAALVTVFVDGLVEPESPTGTTAGVDASSVIAIHDHPTYVNDDVIEPIANDTESPIEVVLDVANGPNHARRPALS